MNRSVSVLMLTLLLVGISTLPCTALRDGLNGGPPEQWLEVNIGEKPDASKTWIAFDDTCSPKPPSVRILESSQQRCVIDVTTYGMRREIVHEAGRIFAKISLPNYGFTGEVGKPQLPAIRGLIEIPPGKKARPKITEVNCCELSDCVVYPSQGSTTKANQTADKLSFTIDMEAYASNCFYPNSVASVGVPGLLRDRTVTQLSVCPIRFHPTQRKLEVATYVRIEIEFYGHYEAQARLEDLSSTAFNEVCSAAVLNSKPDGLKTSEEGSVGYLIICNDTFHSALTPFTAWKTAKGLNVTSVRLSDIGSDINATDILNFIRSAFYNWTPPPTYVLLVGDVDYLPTGKGVVSQDDWETPVPSDNYFACVHGNDSFPDLFVGRLPAKNVTELNNILDKTMGYAGFPEARVAFLSTFEYLTDWFYDFAKAHDYGGSRLYGTYGNATISDLIYTLSRPHAILHVDSHGWITYWEASGFTSENVTSLNPVRFHRYPILFSDACGTGNYEHEHDLGNPEIDCLCEAWLKIPNKGAVAALGPSDVSSLGEGDRLFRGFYSSFLEDNLTEFGPLTVAGKLYMYNYYGDTLNVQRHFDLFNVLGDPQLELDPFRPRKVPEEYPTIQEAINQARGGERIIVGEGTYPENIVINKTLKISGAGETASRLVGSGYGAVVTIAAMHVEISGFTITSDENRSDYGVRAYSTGTCITDNTIANSNYGVYMTASGNTITGNTVENNSCGMCLQASGSNVIFHNSFLDNTFDASLTNSHGNVWDNGCEGNFWAAYNGTDLNGDGVGDQPCVIDGNNEDRYPLMNPYWNPADVNHDLKVNIYDAVLICDAYKSRPGKPKWNPHCDIAEPYGIIDIFDVVMMAGSYGEEYNT